MRSVKRGRSTSNVEISNVSEHGIWILVNHKEYHLPYDKYPWFKEASISEISDVKLIGENHLHWEKLDIDLSLSIIQNPDKYPLVSKA